MARTIAICNHKGGVGKTTTALNVGAGLAAAGKSVLLIDLDAQANLTDSLRITNTAFNIYDVMRGTAEPIPVKATATMDVIPATLDLAGAETEFMTAIGREQILKDILARIQGGYDYILIDTAPSLGLLTINAFTAADEVLIPIQAEYLALKGIAKLSEVIASVQRRINPTLKIGGVVITQYDSRTLLHRQIKDTISAQFGNLLYDTPIRNTIAIAEAQAKGADIFSYAPESAGAYDYRNIVQEFMEKHKDIKA